MQKLNYGGTAWHVYTNLFLGAIFIGIAIHVGIFFHPLFYLLALPAVYFGFEASKLLGFLRDTSLPAGLSLKLVKFVQGLERGHGIQVKFLQLLQNG